MNTNTLNAEPIILSKAELALIENNRKIEELKNQEAKIQLQLEEEREIGIGQELVSKYRVWVENKNRYIKTHFSELTPKQKELYKLVSANRNYTIERKVHNQSLRSEENKYGEKVVFYEVIEYQEFSIKRGDVEISVNEVSTGSRYNSKKEFQMFIPSYVSGRYQTYKVLKTVIAKVDEYFNKQEFKAKEETKKKTLIQISTEKLTELFPECEVKVADEYVSYGSYSRNRGGYYVTRGSVVLKNGLKLHFNVSENGLSIRNVEGLGKLDVMELANLVSGLKPVGEGDNNIIKL